MPTLLSIDLGIRGCGVALFNNDTLLNANYIKNPRGTGNDLFVCRAMAKAIIDEYGDNHDLAIEYPQIYKDKFSKGDNNDLLPLASIAGALVTLSNCVSVVQFKPKEWKGQLPKDASHERIFQRLTLGECERINGAVPKTLLHNVYDAIGIGLYALGRFNPKKSYQTKG